MSTQTSQNDKTSRSDLFEQLLEMAGDSGKAMKQELVSIIEARNWDPNNLTLDQLRRVVATHVREIMAGVLEKKGPSS